MTTKREGIRVRDEVRGNESTERDGKEVRVRVRVRVRERLRVGGNERDCECCFEIFLNAIYRTRGGLKRNRVQWTQFQCIKTESTGLGLYVQKPSSLNSNFNVQKPSPMNSISRHTWTLCPP